MTLLFFLRPRILWQEPFKHGKSRKRKSEKVDMGFPVSWGVDEPALIKAPELKVFKTRKSPAPQEPYFEKLLELQALTREVREIERELERVKEEERLKALSLNLASAIYRKRDLERKILLLITLLDD